MLRVFVALGKQMPKDKAMVEDVQRVSQLLAKYNCTMVQGGAKIGLMGVAVQEFQKYSEEVVMIVPKMHESDLVGTTSKEFYVVEGESDRMRITIHTCDVMIVFPGGSGTLAELAYYNETRKSGEHKGKVVVVNTKGYYNKLFKFMRQQIKMGFMDEKAINFDVIKNADELEPILQQVIMEKQAQLQKIEEEKVKAQKREQSKAAKEEKKVEKSKKEVKKVAKAPAKKVEKKPVKTVAKKAEKIENVKVEEKVGKFVKTTKTATNKPAEKKVAKKEVKPVEVIKEEVKKVVAAKKESKPVAKKQTASKPVAKKSTASKTTASKPATKAAVKPKTKVASAKKDVKTATKKAPVKKETKSVAKKAATKPAASKTAKKK